ncbi:hypothetical protein NEMBOFW57_001106 [Staphylotrichum longicolle]|uniref:Uncharacterized protein n=1 Tax=Staphylotrichum longicolle TaxID=669026 RepID=A0AAD4F116_9PEZI|nr:hypothetical protein NEMBOFW57_001106 [Staphylotrichum longicolle]
MAVVCLAPNLTTLEIGHFYNNSGNTDFLLQKANNRVTGPKDTFTLSKLTTLTVTLAAAYAVKINLHKLNGLLYAAPNLQSLSVDGATGGTSLTARLPNLTSLCLNKSYLTYRGLRLLVRSCINLTTFKLTQIARYSEAAWLPVSPAQILECLVPCRTRLQRLHLAPLVRPYNVDAISEKPFPLLTTLEWFPGLKQVAIDPLAIASRINGQRLVDLLRDCPVLEGFFLLKLTEVAEEELANIAHAAVDLMIWPRLSVIKFQAHDSYRPWEVTQDQPNLQRLQAQLQSDQRDSNASKLERAGVKLVVVSSKETHSFADS